MPVDCPVVECAPTARVYRREDGKPTRYPIEVTMPGSVHLITLDAADKLLRDLECACLDAHLERCEDAPNGHITDEHGDCVPWCPKCGPACKHGNNSLECQECKGTSPP